MTTEVVTNLKFKIMKKVIMISLFAMIFSISSFAQNFNHKPAPKAPKVEEIAKWRADHMKKAYNLDKWQYDKLY